MRAASIYWKISRYSEYRSARWRYFYLRNWLMRPGAEADSVIVGQVVMVSLGAGQVGLVVDYVVGQEEVVIKPLGALLRRMAGLAGATITGDGRIAPVPDMPGLIRSCARRHC